jgi:hypothetical protein
LSRLKEAPNERICLIKHKIPEIILEKIVSYGCDEKNWSQGETEVMNAAIKFIMYFSKSLESSR